MSIVERDLHQRAEITVSPVPGRQAARQQVVAERLPATGHKLRFVGSSAEGARFDPNLARSGALRSEIRSLRRKVLDATYDASRAGRSPLIMVTSALPGDGKSFVSFHLAFSLTKERDLSTTLVDADVARQQGSRLFSGSAAGSLAHCMLEDGPIASAITATDIPNLSMIPAGDYSETVSECLASNRWERVATQMRAFGGDHVFIVDTAPVLSTSEAQYVARVADLVLFVVRGGITPRPAVEQALARLSDLSKVAFVFNGAPSSDSDPYYYYSAYDPR